MYIEKINSPADVKKLSAKELKVLSDEIRTALIQKLSVHGGHVGPNLGIVEATIALHYVFDSPKDKIVFDVSHQSYVHKMLTGRKDAFLDPQKYDSVSGYSEPSESVHDFFILGHTSTSVSLASGLAESRDLVGGKENIIAVIGDGSLSGGEAFEGMDYVATRGTNMIIVVNDNQRSIAEDHGGLYKNLKDLRDSNGECECNLFKAMGLDYVYVDKGNDVEALITAFSDVKDIKHPIVVHINTQKGRGYEPAIEHEEAFHYSAPFDIKTGKLKEYEPDDYSDVTANYLLKKMKEDKQVVTITSGTPGLLGFTPERRKEAGKQFIDVGIAEEHAVALASGIAAGGSKPVYGVFSTFVQRTYDQIAQDLCINNNPAVILVFGGSLTSMNDVTHLCFFDIPLISNIPNMVYLAPTNKEEYLAMLEWGINQQDHPVAIRVPATDIIESKEPVESNYGNLNRYKMTQHGSKVAIVALGSFYGLGESVLALLKEKTKINGTLINPRYITGIDDKMMDNLKADHQLVITLEDGALDGGFGEKIARFYGDTNMKVINYGGKKEFIDRFDRKELLLKNRLTAEQIVEDIQKSI